MVTHENGGILMVQSLVDFYHGIHFLYIGWLWALLPSLLIAGLLLRANRLLPITRIPALFGSQTYRHPRINRLRQLFHKKQQEQSTHGNFWRWINLAWLLVCVHLALAYPYQLGEQLPEPPEYRDTIFLVDTSISMVLRDYLVGDERIDRMTILKGVLIHFIEQLSGSRIGLTVFSERPYTLVPLTADYALLKSMVHRLEPAVLTGRTTDLGKVMLFTLKQLQQSRSSDPSDETVKPVLVLVTDVNRSYRDLDPSAIAAYLHQLGYRLHTIGIGASSYEAREEDSRNLLYQPANFRLLKSIAKNGGGKFYWAENADSLKAAIRAIQAAERRPVKEEPRYITIPLYSWPLLGGLLWLMGMQLWLLVRRPT